MASPESQANATLFGSDRMWGLKELPLPEATSWLPATPAWGIVAALLLALAAWLVWRRIQARRRERYRRVALARVDEMRGDPTALAALPLVLRATALAAYPRTEVASLRGAAWVEWLNENGARFEAEDAPWLDRLPYDTTATEELPPEVAARLLEASRGWIRGHHARV